MWEKLFTADIIRVIYITLGGIGTIYIPNRQLGISMSKRVKHITATVSMFIYSMLITGIYHQDRIIVMWWETLIFWLIANVVFVSIGYDLYRRVDDFLDQKVGKNRDETHGSVDQLDDNTDEIEIPQKGKTE